ncbi:hypothetical protein [Corynebacterium efficiens YS-314]|uniref:Uncharacterized protein n=1 Tax=Corynebacterium efficiens (strain DSM 44549 / YS-314 / AJ 12310 / JCM 11189 / NBRC 100395) TaxID=196164 RepID=Q8FRM2_COREF|nr:hypothetical protein [Corynebacterium efficiens YS-314]
MSTVGNRVLGRHLSLPSMAAPLPVPQVDPAGLNEIGFSRVSRGFRRYGAWVREVVEPGSRGECGRNDSPGGRGCGTRFAADGLPIEHRSAAGLD